MTRTSLQTRIPKAVLLDKLRANRIEHVQIVKEAREGYLQAAKKALRKKLKELADGRVTSLSFGLTLPSDRTADFDAIIGMLEMSSDTEVTLDIKDFHKFVENKWDWTHSFLLSNSVYSATAHHCLSSDTDLGANDF